MVTCDMQATMHEADMRSARHRTRWPLIPNGQIIDLTTVELDEPAAA